ncbi:glycosyltransferase involved in cell wall biosynthesis [Roseimicrobium gellanilyticum]|uniref:Glycosyltransferase involved in cell wall biosynthesis n=1 Tax=Roseimicrobium gellanilyticum TaxID=748857 RepID=A0A366H2Z6_9BACT|nr:glycosyltransferase [Roseimicrobium gellanilyticum]RBP35660.1 glycosyltransferase involved in cell wall biosynthesis [Roseimicrobium gellanilyticum]
MLILLAITLVLWSAGFALLVKLKPAHRRNGTPAGGKELSVSIIIPARNEEENLPRLLASLQHQSHALHEIIVVDDESSDRTAEIAAELGARVVSSAPLPEGWRGKPWACHQGAGASSGSHLLFVDADTWVEENGLQSLLDAYQGGALSVGPWHAVREPYEELSLFFNLNMVFGTVPQGLFGQVLLLDRKSYVRAGGHEIVKGFVLENVMLAHHLRRAGVAVRSILGKRQFSFRMYPRGFSELVLGWVKGFASGAKSTPRGTLAISIAWMTSLAFVPLGWIITGEHVWGATYLLCAVQVGWMGQTVGGFRPLASVFYPVQLLFFFAVFGMSLTTLGRTVGWKGRHFNAR